MSRLVRARVKRLEDLPEWAKCCEERIAAIAAMGEMTLDISRAKPQGDGWVCIYCRTVIPGGYSKAPDIADGLFVDLPVVDLDESGVEGRQYVEAKL